MKALLYVFVAAAGALTSIEAGANAALEKAAGSPWWPALIFNATSLALLALPAMAFAGPFPSAKLGMLPWWGWSGGVLGAVYFLSMMLGPGRLGAGLFTALTVTAAIAASIALDHWGLVGFPVHPVGPGRLIGVALMAAGVICVAAF